MRTGSKSQRYLLRHYWSETLGEFVIMINSAWGEKVEYMTALGSFTLQKIIWKTIIFFYILMFTLLENSIKNHQCLLTLFCFFVWVVSMRHLLQAIAWKRGESLKQKLEYLTSDLRKNIYTAQTGWVSISWKIKHSRDEFFRFWYFLSCL